jgi:hypothetical protein
MKVFISWSGDRSRAVAHLLEDWLQCVLQGLKPWMSASGIERGSLWFNEITGQLQDTRVGIICLTQENREAPWIMFEAGALAKGLNTSRVCTFLIDLAPSEVSNPLAQFNHTAPDKNGVLQLVQTLNFASGEALLKDRVLEKVFETYWPQFQVGFDEACKANPQKEHVEPRSKPDMVAEVLGVARSLERRMARLEDGVGLQERVGRGHKISVIGALGDVLKWSDSSPSSSRTIGQITGILSALPPAIRNELEAAVDVWEKNGVSPSERLERLRSMLDDAARELQKPAIT